MLDHITAHLTPERGDEIAAWILDALFEEGDPPDPDQLAGQVLEERDAAELPPQARHLDALLERAHARWGAPRRARFGARLAESSARRAPWLSARWAELDG